MNVTVGTSTVHGGSVQRSESPAAALLPAPATALPGLGAGANGVEPSRDKLPDLGSLRGLTYLGRRDGSLVGLGDDYKALFAHGIEFVPALGERAASNLPLRLQLLDVRRGEQLVLAGDPAIQPVQSGDRTVAYERAAGVREEFEVLASGVEHRVVLHERPAGNGDLVLRFSVECAAEPRRLPDGTWNFCQREAGGVHYSALHCKDATGNEIPGSVEVAGGRLEWIVPRTFVDRAAYPIVLDPLIGTVLAVSQTTLSCSEPDVAYDTTLDTYLVVWRQAYSGVDSDIRAATLQGTTVANLALLTFLWASERL